MKSDIKRVVIDLDAPMANKLELIRHTIVQRNINQAFEEKPQRATYKAIFQRGLETVFNEVVKPSEAA
jgi:hypothetical protein